ncbi:MAG: NfeD family protein [Ruminococcaceae bacterium]|nr:NfeD family protein [Oscillospiraceae bacterium]
MSGVLMSHMWAVWLAVAVAFLIIELLTTALVSIWFVPGALFTAFFSMLVKNLTVQVLFFLVLAGVAIFLSKKVFRRTKPEQLTNANELLIGKTAIVRQADAGVGARVQIGDVYWRAVSDAPLTVGETVRVTAVNGNTVTVEKQQYAQAKEN